MQFLKHLIHSAKLAPCLLLLLAAGCRVPIDNTVAVEDGQPVMGPASEELLRAGMPREAILQHLGEPSWSTPDGKILCYEGTLDQGKVFYMADFVGTVVFLGGVQIGYAYTGPLVYFLMEPVVDLMESVSPGNARSGDGFIEEVEDKRRALLYFNEKDELKTVMLHKGLEDSLRHSRLVQLYDFVVTAQLPMHYLDKEVLSHVYGEGPAWYSGECNVSFYGEINYDHAKLNGVFIKFDQDGRADQLRRRQFRRPRSGSVFEKELECLLQEESTFLNAAEVAQF
ncbi:MAG TPA: hypothetical protein VK995_01000 [Oceanipulchritudo sp.]|nr:hypothetical protein [Oceanipulchritudo sp.]